jgi:RNA polymerase sigma factor (sigma-70 family)
VTYYYYRHVEGLVNRTREEQNELAVMAQAGDKQAAKDLILSVFRLIVIEATNVAKKYGLDYQDFDDCVNEGVKACSKEAIDKYDPESGNTFWVYAKWWVRRALIKFCKHAIEDQAHGGILDNVGYDTRHSTLDAMWLFSEDFDHDAFKVGLRSKLSVLNDSQQELINYFLLGPKHVTLEVASKKYGVSNERVRQRVKECLKKLRKESGDLRCHLP